MKNSNGGDSFVRRFANTSKVVAGVGNFSSRYSFKNTKNRGCILEKLEKVVRRKRKTEFRDNVKSSSKVVNKKSFVNSTKRSRSDLVYLVRGKDCGKDAWHYVLIDKNKKEMFLAKSRTGSMDVTDYGEVICSGWGKDPPQEVIDKINEEFGL
ncbi:MAG: hypothetical protein LJI21_00225 [Wolbachia endosymbiont of Menacanthus eurysternus]|nr:MAG: hypothetical protein LJI21_00225 [Wolbachia endosymbiont of Menacanthus eurysternus]